MSAYGRLVVALGAALSFTEPSVELGTQLGGRPLEARSGPSTLDASGGVLTLKSEASPMILVRRSTFTMGSSSDEALALIAECQKRNPGHRCNPAEFSDELPPHRVTLSAYWLDRLEVTVADYARCVAASRCKPLPLGDGARRFDRPSYPASLVTWSEARDYCEFRGARLPTEAEFERAARGTSGRTFPWGRLYNSHASNHGRFDWTDPLAIVGGNATDSRDGFVELAPAGSFPDGRTPDGFLDLAGNVAEWVSDAYAPHYDEGDVENPAGASPSAGSLGSMLRVLRGGSFESGPMSLRGAAREPMPPDMRRPSIGFRCAKSADDERE
jgi:formylglycine-generating enzyme required for sulfatase activity